MYISFEQWTGRREIAALGTNAGSTALPFQKWRHFKEAFTPEIVSQAIGSNNGPTATCIDPFGGSGTTPLTCQFMGVRPTVIEVNPYLADLIEAKLSVYDPERLASDLATTLRIAAKVDCTDRLNQLPPSFVEPGIGNRWLFERGAAARILSIADAIDKLTTNTHRILFKVLLGGILVEVSNAIVNGKGRRYRQGWDKRRRDKGDVDLLFIESASNAIGEIRKYGRRACSDFTLVRGDSRTSLDRLGQFDLAVFSPPYPNSFDYTDVYNIELWMLGYLTTPETNRVLRTNTLTSHVQIYRDFAPAPAGSKLLEATLDSLEEQKSKLWNRNIPAMVATYFTEMLQILNSLRDILKDGSPIWSVIGDSRYANVPVNVATILAELAEHNGFRVERLEVLREMRASAQQGGRAQLAESLLVLRCI